MSQEDFLHEPIHQKYAARLAVASKYAALGEMAANLTHEINNPLAAILGRCEMLLHQLQKNQWDHQQILNSIESIEITAKRIEKIIKSMRSFSMAREGDPFQKTSVKSLIDETLEFAQQRFKDYGIDLRISVVNPQWVLECHSTEISQVLLNVLNNSFDAIQNHRERWVELDIQSPSADTIQISITDSGHGINETIAARMFDPFFSTKEKKYGTGLGLSISKGFIERHHGTIELDAHHQHTRFIITLPVQQPLSSLKKV